jgi:3-hydroxyisobutyrate dehydrogenase-like beta-hydroxyacid dehydrogenase
MRVALAGTGHMGSAIAERLLDTGHDVAVWNRTPEKAAPLLERGARAAADVEALLASSSTLVTMLSDDDALTAVAIGALAAADPGTTLIDMSTVSTGASELVAAAAERAGVGYLRAPVSGNPVVVRSGQLMIVVSGPRDVADRAEPLLRAIGPTVHYVGEGERARVVKLALQVMVGGTAELLAEALTLGEAGGVEPRQLLDVMIDSAAGSPFVKYKAGPLVAGDYSATFTTSMFEKDLELVRAFADEHRVDLPLMDDLADEVSAAIAAGYGDLDFMALYLVRRSRSTPE